MSSEDTSRCIVRVCSTDVPAVREMLREDPDEAGELRKTTLVILRRRLEKLKQRKIRYLHL